MPGPVSYTHLILRIFPDKLEGSKTSLILKDTKTEASCRTIFMTAALREELKQWLERLKREEARDPEHYRNSGMLLRLPNGLAVEPVLKMCIRDRTSSGQTSPTACGC